MPASSSALSSSLRGADERAAGEVLLVAGLLADEHQLGLGSSAEDGLRAAA